jgi:hypothetical protein
MVHSVYHASRSVGYLFSFGEVNKIVLHNLLLSWHQDHDVSAAVAVVVVVVVALSDSRLQSRKFTRRQTVLI